MKKLKYNLATIINVGTDNETVMLSHVELPYSEANQAIAQQEAYGGKYEIYDDGLPEPVLQPTTEERVAELEAMLNALLGVSE
jgi:hypothetical protein